MCYLLDTDTVFDLINNPQGTVARQIAAVGEAAICTSIVVAAELRFGAARKALPKLSAKVEATLGMLDVLPLAAPADVAYGDLRARLEAAGTPIGPNDCLIAAHALVLDCTVVTGNTREFGRVDGLRVENWLR